MKGTSRKKTSSKKASRKKRPNPVAKHMERFNRPATFLDRKKANKRGYQKHRHGSTKGTPSE